MVGWNKRRTWEKVFVRGSGSSFCIFLDKQQIKTPLGNLLCVPTKKLAYATQTTLSVDDTKEIIEVLKQKYPDIKGPIKEDICYATTNRQIAVKKIAPNCEMFFVIGSRNSSNSARLVEVAKKSGCKNSELIFYGKKAPIDKIKNCKTIGLSSGASAPEELVQNFISEIKENMKVSIEEIVTANERVVFKLPKELN